jgi:hypothetical protein
VADVKRPSNKSHLERLIDAWSKEDERAESVPGRLRRLVAVSALVEILDGLPQADGPRLAIKGGAALELRFGVTARGSRDVDAVTNVSFEDAFAEITDRLKTGWQGFTGTITDRTEITRAGIDPPPQRTRVKLFYDGKPFATIPFELGLAEASSFAHLEEVRNAVDLTKVQLPEGDDVVVLGVEYQIAQKLHACTEVFAEGDNKRVHDLYDILLLAPLLTDDRLYSARLAAEEVFTNRAKQPWPPALPSPDDWPATWAAIDVPEDPAPPTYDEARSGVTVLIDAIAAAEPPPAPDPAAGHVE